MLRKPAEKKERMQRASVLPKQKPRGVPEECAHEGGQLLLYKEGHSVAASFPILLKKSHELGEGREEVHRGNQL